MNATLQLLRPHQYVKNGFVFLGPLFSHQWALGTLIDAGLAFLAFCAMASAVYVLNDLLDIEADAAHPTKCQRPLPSGRVSLGQARGMIAGLVALALMLGFQVSSEVALCLAAYFALNVLYSMRLKHVVVLDIFLISSGFMLRILAGTLGLDIEPSEWLLLCGLMVTLFLGFAKRRAELLLLERAGDSTGGKARRVLDEYNPQLLEQYLSITAACTILCYGLYTVSPQTLAIHHTQSLVFTVPFVVYGIFRYLYVLHGQARGNDTARDLFQDPHLLLTALGWMALTLVVLA